MRYRALDVQWSPRAQRYHSPPAAATTRSSARNGPGQVYSKRWDEILQGGTLPAASSTTLNVRRPPHGRCLPPGLISWVLAPGASTSNILLSKRVAADALAKLFAGKQGTFTRIRATTRGMTPTWLHLAHFNGPTRVISTRVWPRRHLGHLALGVGCSCGHRLNAQVLSAQVLQSLRGWCYT